MGIFILDSDVGLRLSLNDGRKSHSRIAKFSPPPLVILEEGARPTKDLELHQSSRLVEVIRDRSRRRVFNPPLDDFCLLLRSLLMAVFTFRSALEGMFYVWPRAIRKSSFASLQEDIFTMVGMARDRSFGRWRPLGLQSFPPPPVNGK